VTGVRLALGSLSAFWQAEWTAGPEENNREIFVFIYNFLLEFEKYFQAPRCCRSDIKALKTCSQANGIVLGLGITPVSSPWVRAFGLVAYFRIIPG